MTDSAVDPAALEFWCSTNSTPIEVATARTWPCYSAVSASAPAIRACCTSAPARRCIAVFVDGPHQDRKSTRLNSSHLVISYAVFCLKKKNTIKSWKQREVLG